MRLVTQVAAILAPVPFLLVFSHSDSCDLLLSKGEVLSLSKTNESHESRCFGAAHSLAKMGQTPLRLRLVAIHQPVAASKPHWGNFLRFFVNFLARTAFPSYLASFACIVFLKGQPRAEKTSQVCILCRGILSRTASATRARPFNAGVQVASEALASFCGTNAENPISALKGTQQV